MRRRLASRCYPRRKRWLAFVVEAARAASGRKEEVFGLLSYLKMNRPECLIKVHLTREETVLKRAVQVDPGIH